MVKFRNHLRLTVGLVSAGWLLAGCTQSVWVKLGASDADFQIAKGQCLSAAYSQVPSAPATAVIGSGYTSPIVTNCTGYGNNTRCFSSGGSYTPPAIITYDANSGIRNDVFSGCMYADGWSLQKEGEAATTTESAWTKGFNIGLRDRHQSVCDEAPSDILKASDWRLGCHSGQNIH